MGAGSHEVGRGTIAEMLARHGIEPAPERERKTNWKEFLTQHWDLIVAADFFTVEAWTRRGVQRFFILFFMELSDAQGEDCWDRVESQWVVRAQPPRFGQCTDLSRARACGRRRRSASAGTSRRAAELLLPQGCLRITPTFDRDTWCPMYRRT